MAREITRKITRKISKKFFQRTLLSILCTSLAFSSSIEAKNIDQWQDHISQGQQALKDGQYAEAKNYLSLALEDTRKFKDDDPRMGLTFYNLGNLYVSEQNYHLAKEYFQRALANQQKILGAQSVEVADSLYGIALCHQQLGDQLAAEIFLKRVNEIWRKKLNPDDPKLLNILPALGAYASIKSDFAQASNCYREIVSIKEKTQAQSPNNDIGNYLNLLATSLGNEGKYKEAEATAKQAIEKLRESDESSIAIESAQDNLRIVEMRTKAKIISNKEIYTDDQAKIALENNRGETQKTEIQNKEIAKKEKIEISNNENKQTKQNLLNQQKHTTNTEKKEEIAVKPKDKIENSIAENSSQTKPWEIEKSKDLNSDSKNLSDKQKQNENWGKVRYLTDGRLISGEEYKALLLAAEAYEMMRQEKYRMAVDILVKALDTYPNLPSVHTNLGLALARLGQNDEAIDHFRKSIALDPNRSAAWINLASSFQNNGKLKDCIITYDEYLRRFPKDNLAVKAQEIVEHLKSELKEQNKIEKNILTTNAKKDEDNYFAYTTSDDTIKWLKNKETLKVYLPHNTKVPGYKSEYYGILTEAFKQWEAVASSLNNSIHFEFIKKPELADIECIWTNDIAQVKTAAEGGEAQLDYNDKGITHAKIVILTVAPTPDSPLGQNQIEAVCLHEIGHSLGLLGHSPFPQDIMYCTMPVADKKLSISQRDAKTLTKLYSDEVLIALSNEEGKNKDTRAYAQTIAKLEKEFQLDPNNENTKVSLGKAYNSYASELLNEGQLNDAESLMQKALNLHKSLRDKTIKLLTLKNYATLLHRQKREKEAQTYESEAKLLEKQI